MTSIASEAASKNYLGVQNAAWTLPMAAELLIRSYNLDSIDYSLSSNSDISLTVTAYFFDILSSCAGFFSTIINSDSVSRLNTSYKISFMGVAESLA